MPELPEVEITTRNLARWTAGRSVVRVELPDAAVVRARLSTSPSAAVADPAGTRAWLGPCGAPRRRAELGAGLLAHGQRPRGDEVQVVLAVASQARQRADAGKVVAPGRWAAFRSGSKTFDVIGSMRRRWKADAVYRELAARRVGMGRAALEVWPIVEAAKGALPIGEELEPSKDVGFDGRAIRRAALPAVV